jgi:hypothetical protein
MEKVTFTFDEKGCAYDGAPTLVTNELPERGGYFAIHNNAKIAGARCSFAVSFFATDAIANDSNSWTFDNFRDFQEVIRFFQALGLTLDAKSSEPIHSFIRSFLNSI